MCGFLLVTVGLCWCAFHLQYGAGRGGRFFHGRAGRLGEPARAADRNARPLGHQRPSGFDSIYAGASQAARQAGMIPVPHGGTVWRPVPPKAERLSPTGGGDGRAARLVNRHQLPARPTSRSGTSALQAALWAGMIPAVGGGGRRSPPGAGQTVACLDCNEGRIDCGCTDYCDGTRGWAAAHPRLHAVQVDRPERLRRGHRQPFPSSQFSLCPEKHLSLCVSPAFSAGGTGAA